MIRLLPAMALLLLVSGHAYAGSVADTFSGQIVAAQDPPPAIVCDFGPNNASVPTEANRAGFTRCALNADFTTSSTDKNGINFANTATYINECGANLTWQFYINWWSNPPAHAPCNRATIVSDNGTNVLQMQYLTGDWNVGCAANGNTWPGGVPGNQNYHCGDFARLDWPTFFSNNPTPALPGAMYTEITFRVPSAANFNPAPNAVESFDWWVTNVSVNNYEEDFMEVEDNSGPPWNANWSVANGGGYISGGDLSVDWTSYHTEQNLYTNNGSGGNTVGCYWIDGTFGGCKEGRMPTLTAADNGHIVEVDVGGASCSGGDTNPPLCAPNGITVYVKRILVMECPGYNTGSACTGSLITGP